MSLSAIDCIGRGVANLRANWELVLLQLAQTILCAVMVVGGGVALIMILGASFLLQLSDPSDWSAALERLQGFSVDVGLLAIALAATTILLTLVGLVYCWFQAGIMATLERGERQAPPAARVGSGLFRTFSLRNFAGWSHAGAWRYFNYFGLLSLVGAAILGVFMVAMLLGTATIGEGAGAAVFGCLAFVPLAALLVVLNIWVLIGMALLPRQEFGVWRATRGALTILRHRFGGALLLTLLFVLASAGVTLIFWPLGQGMASALEGSLAAFFVVQLLLTVAQWMVNGILTVALFGSVTALVRTELDPRAI